MKFLRLTVVDLRAIALIAAYILLLAVLPLVLPESDFRRLFSEEGPFEQLSIVAWLFAALIIAVRIRPLGPRAWAFLCLFVIFAAREADWHKAFTTDSILKSNYYRHSIAPLEEKLIGGFVAIAVIALAIYVGFVIVRFLFLQGGWRSRAGFWLLIGAGAVAFGKVLDRAPAVLMVDFGIAVPSGLQLFAAAFEEGLEMIHPLIFAWSIWISQTERPYLGRTGH